MDQRIPRKAEATFGRFVGRRQRAVPFSLTGKGDSSGDSYVLQYSERDDMAGATGNADFIGISGSFFARSNELQRSEVT